ncbi:alpha/beta hydrolase [soil metagenome]
MALDPQARTLLDQLAALDAPAAQDQQLSEARDGWRTLSVIAGAVEEVASVADRAIPGPAGDIGVRVYRPADPSGAVLVWFHGGGWVLGDLESADANCRALANRSGAVVVSVDYRLAPEHPSPAGFDDCLAATSWVAARGADLGVDPARLAVGGDSAGANLAALVAIAARHLGAPVVRFQLLVYPVTDLTMGHPSIEENADGYLLTAATMRWFTESHLAGTDPADPSVSPLLVDDLSGLPPALVMTAGFDPLRDEGDAYAARLAYAGVAVDHTRYDTMIHGFFGMTALFEVARAAMDRAGATLRDSLA